MSAAAADPTPAAPTSVHTGAATTERIAHRICPLCEACCGLEIRIRDESIAGIRGDAADPFSGGYICPKGFALKDLHEDPDRLRQPLIRRDGVFVKSTWDEAFAEIERRLLPIVKQGGRDALALSLGNPSVHKFGLILYFARLLKASGSKNFYSASTLDQMPKQLSSGLMFGHWLSIPVPDIERCDLLVVIGANPVASNGSLWTVPDFRGKARDLHERGGQLVVIDPRRTETAAVADAWHPIRPGADAFLLAAIVHTLFDEKLVRLGAIAEHLNGVDTVRDAVADFSPELVAERCGIAATDIRSLARQIAAAHRACVYGRLGTCTQSFGTLSSWLVDVVNALTGHLDQPGGAMFAQAPAFAANTMGRSGSGRGITTGRWRSRVSGAPEVFGELPMGCLAEEIETEGAGQIRALITIASNPVLSAPDGQRLAAALDSLDFMVSVDIYLNETTRHADVILPGLSPLEEPHYDVAFAQLSWRNQARYSAAVFAPPPDQIPEWQILIRLAAILQGRGAQADAAALDDEQFTAEVQRQFGDRAPAVMAALAGRNGPERVVDLGLRSGPFGDGFGARPDGLTLAQLENLEHGVDLGALAPRIPEILRTPSGKVELAPPSLIADMVRLMVDLASPRPAMTIVGRRDVRSNNSWMHNLPTLAKGPERCTLHVHPDDAARLALVDGAMARVRSVGGAEISVPVTVTDRVSPGVVSLPHGWGHDLSGSRLSVAALRPGANLNALFDSTARDPLSGNAVLSGVEVTVTAA
jgi:anaerobic selenocysteine-containing dehydrogenase